MEKIAFNKGWKIISSCKDIIQINVAFNYVNNYREMFGDTVRYRYLYNYCVKRKKILE